MCKTKEQRLYDNYKRFVKTVYKDDDLSIAEKERWYSIAENDIDCLDNPDVSPIDSAKSSFMKNWLLLDMARQGNRMEKLIEKLCDRMENKRSLQAGEAIVALCKVLFSLFRKRA